MPTYNYFCKEHGIFTDNIKYEVRDEDVLCPECGEPSPRTWEGHTTNYTKVSYTDLNTKRFTGVKENLALKKEKAKARERGDRVSERIVNQEIKKLGGK